MSVEEQADKRVIKRYSNRKLYDTRDSRYVTLQQIGEMVRRGEDVQIIDNKTKEDKTEVTLALILSEDLKNKPRSVPLGTLRTLIQERGGRMLESLRGGPLGRLLPGDKPGDGDAAVELKVDGHAPAPPPPPPPSPAVPPPATVTAKKRTRFDDLVESSRQTLDQLQTTLDERVAAIVPGVAPIRELRAQVKALTQRVEALEGRLGMSGDPVEGASPGAPPTEDELHRSEG
jgi:polyhydroxyalkanoate synthesis repressor PhaR